MKRDSPRELGDLFDEVDESGISSIRHVVNEVVAAMANPAASIQDLKNIIEIDPPLAAKVMRLANSAFYSRGRSYKTIEEAVIWLGFDTVLRLTLSQKVCELFASGDGMFGYSRRRLWRHCTATALLARLVQRREFGVPGEMAYVVGLLHDIGIIVADQFRHPAFCEALRQGAEDRRPLGEGLRQALGVDHLQIGSALARRWRWPEELVTAIAGGHTPFSVSPGRKRMVCTLYLANRYSHGHDLGHGATVADSGADEWEQVLRELSVSELSLEMIEAELRAEITHLEVHGLM